jgi:hypothetical protein
MDLAALLAEGIDAPVQSGSGYFPNSEHRLADLFLAAPKLL